MKKIFPFLIGFVVLFVLMFLVLLFDRPAPPEFSALSGYYSEPFELSLSSAGQNETIHYTLDGSEPTINSPIYSEPLLIRDRSDEPNDISMVPTISYVYYEPHGTVNKINVIRARSINNLTKAESPIVTHSYVVNEDVYNWYSLPIISLVVDPFDLFDQRTGIYVTGKGPEVQMDSRDRFYFRPANYHERGSDWERPVYVQYFDLDGELQISQNAGVRIHGGASRSFRQKSLRLYADRKYDQVDQLEYAAFPNLFDNQGPDSPKDYETLILRNSGTDFGSAFMRDVVTHRLISHTSVETQEVKPVIVFLNGEYWGLYFIYERYDQGYFKHHYGVDPTNLIMLENRGSVSIGVHDDHLLFARLRNSVVTGNIDDENFFSDVKKQIDIDNFIDYQITQIFVAHRDWPSNNHKFWRVRVPQEGDEIPAGHDGRWRWLMLDTDHGFTYTEFNSMVFATREDLPTELLRTLVYHPEFQDLFLNRFADHLNSTFRTERVIREIDEIFLILKPEMEEQINRWHSSGATMERWKENVAFLRSFARQRPDIMIQHLIGFFELDGTFTLTLESDSARGFVQVNSLELLPTTPGIEDSQFFQGVYFKNIPIVINAIPHEGYQFSHWESQNNHFASVSKLKLTSSGDLSLQPVFIPLD